MCSNVVKHTMDKCGGSQEANATSPYAKHVHSDGFLFFFFSPLHKASCQIFIYNEFLGGWHKGHDLMSKRHFTNWTEITCGSREQINSINGIFNSPRDLITARGKKRLAGFEKLAISSGTHYRGDLTSAMQCQDGLAWKRGCAPEGALTCTLTHPSFSLSATLSLWQSQTRTHTRTHTHTHTHTHTQSL